MFILLLQKQMIIFKINSYHHQMLPQKFLGRHGEAVIAKQKRIIQSKNHIVVEGFYRKFETKEIIEVMIKLVHLGDQKRQREKKLNQDLQPNQYVMTFIDCLYNQIGKDKYFTLIFPKYDMNLRQFCEKILRKKSTAQREKIIVILTIQMLQSVLYMHQNMVVLRDIKPDNFVVKQVEGRWKLKLIDLGTAKQIIYDNTKEDTYCGTTVYMPPQMLIDKEWRQKRMKKNDNYKELLLIDSWCLGVTIYELANKDNKLFLQDKRANKHPSQILNQKTISSMDKKGIEEMIKNSLDDFRQFLIQLQNHKTGFDNRTNRFLKDLLSSLVHIQAKQRKTVAECKQSSRFKQFWDQQSIIQNDTVLPQEIYSKAINLFDNLVKKARIDEFNKLGYSDNNSTIQPQIKNNQKQGMIIHSDDKLTIKEYKNLLYFIH